MEMIQRPGKTTTTIAIWRITTREAITRGSSSSSHFNNSIFETLKKEWIQSYKDLPWGDSLVYELEHNPNRNNKMFLADGTIFGLWVIRVDTIEGFEVKW